MIVVMLNMSNLYYKFISEVLINFFKETALKPGDRYYIQLDDKDETKLLYNALKIHDGVKPFEYRHELGEKYITFTLEIGNVNLVVSRTSEKVKPDFLVTLRNEVSRQEGKWKGTALLSIVSEQLDSIQGGSSNLQKEGMPLHSTYISNQLKQLVNNSSMTKVEKYILNETIDSITKEQDFQHVSFLEFLDLYIIIAKGKFDDQDYKKFGLFKDEDLETFLGNDFKKRLSLNKELFDFVRKVHEYGLEKEELERHFTEAGAKKLFQNDWEYIPFSEVHKDYEKNKESNKKLKIQLKEINVNEKLVIWDKPLKESTSSGRRKRQVIIFNPEHLSEINLQIGFNIEGGNVNRLSKEYFSLGKGTDDEDTNITIGKTNINIGFENIKGKVKFFKFTYKHNNKTSLGAEFNIAILPIEPELLDSIKTNYQVGTNRKVIEIVYEGNEIIIGNGYNKIYLDNIDNSSVNFTNDDQLLINPLPEAFDDDDELKININYLNNQVLIPLLLKSDVPESVPIVASRIWKLKREKQMDFELVNSRLIFGNQKFYVHSEYEKFFNYEKEWIENNIRSGTIDSETLLPIDIELSVELREAYSRFITYFKINNNIPSLSFYSNELISRAKEYVLAYINEIKKFQEGIEAGNAGRDLFKLGILSSNNILYFTPFHPLVVAYQIKVYELLQEEIVDNSILKRLKSDGLIPYLYNYDGSLYRPDDQLDLHEWLLFRPVNEISVSEVNKYLAIIVEQKIRQFYEHFEFLFSIESNAPLKINVINISNNKELLTGIFNWMLNIIEKKGLNYLKPIEVTIYNNEINYENSFDVFSRIDSVEEFKNYFNIPLEKYRNFEEKDLLRYLRENLTFFKLKFEDEIRYAHISFYKMHFSENYALQPMADMYSGIALDGLYSSVSFMEGKENYKSGFGIKAYGLDEENILIQTAYYLNELAANMNNGGNNSYHKGESILSITTPERKSLLNRILSSSHWVTFIEPNFDLEFFNKKKDELIIVHYSDQYSSSNKFDAITVTKKSDQYNFVIKEFLESKDIEASDTSVQNIVKSFNTFNGEWLLNIISNKGLNKSKEKMSIISAIKFALSYFDHNDILWVPISMEEILRVAGVVGLGKSDGIFTAKNLGVSKKNYSDDILLIGLEEDKNNIKLHYFPIEVKIGINRNEVLDKARKQVIHTKEILIDALKVFDDGEVNFTAKFYRNFFVQMFIANARKLASSNFWNTKNYKLPDTVIEKLLKGEYTISNDLVSYIGEGAILSFQKDSYFRSAVFDIENNITLLNLTEQDGFQGLVSDIEEMHQWIQKKDNDFIKENMLSYQYNFNKTGTKIQLSNDNNRDAIEKVINVNLNKVSKETNNVPINNKIESINNTEESMKSLNQQSNSPENETKPDKFFYKNIKDNPKMNLNDVRILLGQVEGSNKKIYWEYGNKGLANRHLLISGKSGQGKTYFMQCLLLEKSKHNISSIVIDYTEGFLPNQLEPEFIGFLGDKIKHRIVYNEKLPINPFKRNTRDIGGIVIPETNTDIAERVKSVFAAVYRSLGVQQLNAIYEATLNGLETYSESMDLIKLKEMLENDGSSYSKTALSQIRPLIDRNPFTHDNLIDWNDVVNGNGDIFIIQLTGYPRDVQLIITEFILWDLWNFSVTKGNKNKPMPVILDEAQNLDHTEKSPSARILTEGRKFGWSAWYATQFLKSQLNADELARLQNSAQKVYFSPPEQEVSNIASSLTNDPGEKKMWENKLLNLKKGQCIVYGPILKDNNTEMTQPIAMVVNITSLSERI